MCMRILAVVYVTLQQASGCSDVMHHSNRRFGCELFVTAAGVHVQAIIEIAVTTVS